MLVHLAMIGGPAMRAATSTARLGVIASHITVGSARSFSSGAFENILVDRRASGVGLITYVSSYHVAH